MKNTVTSLLLFTAGAAVGSLVTWKFLKTKYERIAQEEIDSVKEMWGTFDREDDDEDEYIETEDDEDDWDETVVQDYAAITRRYSGASDNKSDNDKEGEGDGDGFPYINGPYVISPDEFGDGNFGHALHCITYYADGVLADDWWVELDIEETIGEEAIEAFGKYVDDVVHVRNERLQADYEVTRDPRRYEDVLANDPLVQMYANRGTN